MGRLALELCGKDAGYQCQPRRHTTIDLGEAKAKIEAEGGKVLADAGVLIVVQVGHVEASVYRNAKLLLKTTDKDVAEQVATAIYGVLGVAV